MRREIIQQFLRGHYLKQGFLKVKRATRTGHSGWEIRLAASSPDEARRIERSLKALGLRSGRPFKKGKRIVIPLYGEHQVHLFFEEIHPEQLSLFAPPVSSADQ
ncbi:MAG: hypothetical protein V2G42_05045 [bacterium JZ-2024 1]